MNILDKIIVHKKLEVAEKSSLVPVKLLEQSVYFDSSVVSMKKYIKHEDKQASSQNSKGNPLPKEPSIPMPRWRQSVLGTCRRVLRHCLF
jgi:hypothetical protein